ncbi:34665_t:CDS:2 [Gigaspora margarita]|uniref:34665_t:CDS:1 n=1 Tax=Gigaspora margarita TaxID=4874 RepID=A0ABN7X044_GIGMA|nr:34665_t:CDS:2 [Gigaspora margarita]
MSVYSSDNNTSSEVSHNEYLEDLPGFDTSIDCSQFPSTSVMAFNHFYVNPHLLKVWISYPLARFLFYYFGNPSHISIVVSMVVRVLLIENHYDLDISTFSWFIYGNDVLNTASYMDVIRGFGCDPNDEEFSLKLLLERTIVFEQSNGDDTYDPTIERQDGYSSEDSMITKSDEVLDEYFVVQEDNPVSPIMGKLDFSYLDDYKCRFCKRYVCNCWASYTSADINDDDYYYSD